MHALADRADSPEMNTGDEVQRGARIQERFDALGISDREWHAQTGIDRKTLHRAMQGATSTRSSTFDAIEANLDKLEARVHGAPVAVEQQPGPGFIRFKVEGVYGARALVVEGPVENLAELEAMVDRVMRRLRDEDT